MRANRFTTRWPGKLATALGLVLALQLSFAGLGKNVAYARTTLGGMNLSGFCASHGGGYASNGGNVNNWSCQGGVGTRGIDMNSVCQWMYGSGAFPAYRSFSDPGSWYCFTDNPSGGGQQTYQPPQQYQPPPPPPPTRGARVPAGRRR